jgi:hypothetical protein
MPVYQICRYFHGRFRDFRKHSTLFKIFKGPLLSLQSQNAYHLTTMCGANSGQHFFCFTLWQHFTKYTSSIILRARDNFTMCQNCYPSTRTSVALTWAIPVDILQLGSSLAAYSKVKPSITQLQLCHRFGRGPNVSE